MNLWHKIKGWISGLSIRWKILGPVALMVAGSIFLSILVTIDGFNRYRQGVVENRALYLIDDIFFTAEVVTSPAELQLYVSNVGADQSVDFIAVIAPASGEILATTRVGWNGQHVSELPATTGLAADLAGFAPDQIRELVDFGDGISGMVAKTDYTYPLSLDDSQSLTVFVRLNTSAMPLSVGDLAWRQAGWQLLGALFALGLISYSSYVFVLRPVARVWDILVAHEKGDDPDAQGLLHDELGALGHALVDLFRATRESEARLAHLAQRDSLTGLANRALFKERLHQGLAISERNAKPLGLMLLDLDNFKDVNDTQGHDVGDQLLQRTAVLLRECARKSDTVARLGGDEFAIIMNDIEDPASVTRLAARVIRTLAQPQTIGSHVIHPGTSIGITIFPQDGRDADVLLKNADLALYRAKGEGRGNFQLYRHELHLRAMERNAIERDLHEALEQGQFALYYQPKIDLRTGLINGAEALVRWNHPTRGIIPPNMFIPVAEQNGFIVELTRWVIEEACRQNRAWQEAGLPLISVAVNVSALDLRDSTLTDHVATTLIHTGLSPKFLEIEVTESMVMEDVDVVIGTLRRLRSLGIAIAIDDFGTGYSSLAYLRKFPVKCLKIDRSFMSDVVSARERAGIPKIIVDLARSLGVKVVAEGVETAQQLQALQGLDCDEAQGYYIGRPAPADEFAAFLSNHKPSLILTENAGVDGEAQAQTTPVKTA